MSDTSRPSPEQILAGMRQAMGRAPSAIEKSVAADADLIHEHMRSRAFAMPAEGALDDETRTLIYLAAALAGSSHACIQAMADKVAQQRIPAAKVVETVRIARYAMATKVIGDAEPVFAVLGASD
ncbi:carboxymuconolactone decarboxylase family protein [Candidatus Igneacidithiobacillus taiwanensis]|uniref:carboxymuconolactone decarboxylase family protein n=1 Tax=Candidatus Igneacidithiobacillus taiwanensis TaxID=1945924 RepID=UPI002896F90D|nr:carboxymuconolactone decarboxylase family protein [Candidatus Igneacidithiobacillus taiwanensis]